MRTGVLRGRLAIVPRTAPNLERARGWFRGGRANEEAALEEYCVANAVKFDDFEGEWVEANRVLNLLPVTREEWERRWRGRELVEVEDGEAVYWLRVEEWREAGETAPYEYAREDVKRILLNKRRMAFVEELEREVRREGMERGYVKYY